MKFDNNPRIMIETPHSACGEHNRLLDEFGGAVKAVLDLHEQQFLSIVDGEDDFCRFDVLIHIANERKQEAKYAYLRHVEAHGCCSNANALDTLDETRTRSHHRQYAQDRVHSGLVEPDR
jgi:hypothetical protein